MNDRDHFNKRSTGRLEFAVRLFLPVSWAIAILWLSLTPAPPHIPGPLGWDKLLHSGAYALLALLLAQFLHVITSYSIHYTKLYDAADVFDIEAVLR